MRMLAACYREAVGNLQIKDVPEGVHRRLRARAAEAGMSQRDYVLRLIERDLRLPSKTQWLRQLRSDPPTPDFDAAALIREVREEREADLDERLRRRFDPGPGDEPDGP
jgi:plasmid stability protein